MRTVGLKLESSVFTATMAKIIRKYQELPISQIKQIVSNNDYVYKCDIIRANGIKTLLHVKKDLSKERINSYIYVEGKLTSEEYLNNLLVSYKQTEEQVEEEMDREALLKMDPNILVSMINMKLRDDDMQLSHVLSIYDLDETEFMKRLDENEYFYDESTNQIKTK